MPLTGNQPAIFGGILVDAVSHLVTGFNAFVNLFDMFDGFIGYEKIIRMAV